MPSALVSRSGLFEDGVLMPEAKQVQSMFARIAGRYDLLNDDDALAVQNYLIDLAWQAYEKASSAPRPHHPEEN